MESNIFCSMKSVLGMQQARTLKKSPFLSAQKRATKPIDASVMLERLCRKQATIKVSTCLSKWGPWAHCSLLNDQISALLNFLLSKRKTNSHYWRKWSAIVLATQSCVTTMDYLLGLCSSLALVLHSLRLGICHLRFKKILHSIRGFLQFQRIEEWFEIFSRVVIGSPCLISDIKGFKMFVFHLL